MSDSKLSRRDFLKLATLTSAGLALSPLVSSLDREADSATPNVFIFVFDAWTGADFQLYGYPRQTMPNMERFAGRALVYHNHYSAGSYTVPGTASLLTGLYPWTHRALTLTSGGVTPAHQEHNLFAAFAKSRATFGFAQNPYADVYLHQFGNNIDTHLDRDSFNLERSWFSGLPVFGNDARMASVSIEDNIIRNDQGSSGSVYLASLWRLFDYGRNTYFRKKHLRKYYYRLPSSDGAVFLLDKLLNGLVESIRQFKSPTLAYFHLIPPHDPYAPTRKFSSYFDDGWTPPVKPVHRLFPLPPFPGGVAQ